MHETEDLDTDTDEGRQAIEIRFRCLDAALRCTLDANPQAIVGAAAAYEAYIYDGKP